MAMRLYSNVLANVLNQSSKDLDMTPFQVHVSKNYFLRKFIFIVVKVKSKWIRIQLNLRLPNSSVNF